MILDSHNHLQAPRLGDVSAIIARMKEKGLRGCVINSVNEADWKIIQNLAQQHAPFIRPAYGIHPWHAHKAKPDWEKRLEKTLCADPTATIGECGLDGWVKDPQIVMQRDVFQKHLHLAAELERPVTIHCLKAWQALFDLIRDHQPWPKKFLLHSFGGSLEVAERLWKAGAYFSFSGYFLLERKSSVVEVFQKIPKDRILLESDAPDMLPPAEFIEFPMENDANHPANHPANLPRIAAALATRLGISEAHLIDQVCENEIRFWGVARPKHPQI